MPYIARIRWLGWTERQVRETGQCPNDLFILRNIFPFLPTLTNYANTERGLQLNKFQTDSQVPEMAEVILERSPTILSTRRMATDWHETKSDIDSNKKSDTYTNWYYTLFALTS